MEMREEIQEQKVNDSRNACESVLESVTEPVLKTNGDSATRLALSGLREKVSLLNHMEKNDSSDSIESQWAVVFERLKNELGDKLALRWLKKIEPSKIESGTVYLFVPSPCIGELVSRNYSKQMLAIWREHNNAVRDLSFQLKPLQKKAVAPVESKKEVAVKAPAALPAVQAMQVSDEQGESMTCYLNPAYTFDSFIVGQSNEFACAAARRVAEDINASFNPLYLHSSVGLGKTHLMHAIAWKMQEMQPGRTVMYLSSEQFVHRFIKSLRSNTTASFRDMFRSVDVLMIDDVQFICGKKATQEEFFHTFNALISQGKKIILSSDSSPSDLKGIEDRLKTRLVQGLVVDIHPATYELRLAILEEKVARMGTKVPHEVLEFLAKHITSNVRELEGALKRIVAHADLIGATINLENTKKVLSDVLHACERVVSIPEIQSAVADYFHIKLAELKGNRRDRKIARPRQIAMYLSKVLTTLSLPDIALQFGRDHTTIMHAVKTIEKLQAADSEMAHDIQNITTILQEG